MKKDELQKWAIEIFWSAYTGLVKTPVPTKFTAGARGEAVKKVLTLNPPADLRKRIIDSISAQMKHRRDLFNKCGSMQKYISETDKVKFYCNRNGATWLNQYGWEDEIPSMIDEKKIYHDAVLRCSNKDCPNMAIGGNISICQSCEAKNHDIYREEKRDYLRRHKLTKDKNETLHDYAARCKEHAFALLPDFGG